MNFNPVTLGQALILNIDWIMIMGYFMIVHFRIN